MNIIIQPTATVEQAIQWAKNKNATSVFVTNARIYWRIAKDHGHVNPVVAYAQYAKETGYGKFGGVLNASYCNPCGLKTTQGGANDDPSAHTKFASWEDGISAQLDHLALYAGAVGFPRSNTLDPRHFAYLLGKCKTVEELSGNWAPDANYGSSIVKLCREIKSIKVKEITMPKEVYIQTKVLGAFSKSGISIKEYMNKFNEKNFYAIPCQGGIILESCFMSFDEASEIKEKLEDEFSNYCFI